ncbi:hypothetical protein GCM10028857_07170 [Salinarchaeum chitinilyticum]
MIPIGVDAVFARATAGAVSVEPIVLVGLGGAAGALTRFAVGELVAVDRFPVSVIVVNVLGTFLATLLAVRSPGAELALLASVGFCGALTTFSTFSVQTVRLWEEDRPAAATSFALGTLLACLLGAGLAIGVDALL